MKLSIFLCLGLYIVGCSTQKENKGDKPHIVATTGMLYDAVIHIGKNYITAEAIMGPGVDPHLYKATQGDLYKLKSANLIVYNGLLLEGKMSTIIGKLGRRQAVIAAAEAVPKERLKSALGYPGSYDPHIWFDVQNWKYVVKAISEKMISLDTTHRSTYVANTDLYLNRLDSLDIYIKRRLSEIPKNQRILITAHDAFVYFGDAYDIRVESIQGISTVADFGLKDIAHIIDLIIENKIKAIFVETSVSKKSINAVIEGCKGQGYTVKIGGYLYSDAMGEFGTEEGTYIGMFKKNVETLVEALK